MGTIMGCCPRPEEKHNRAEEDMLRPVDEQGKEHDGTWIAVLILTILLIGLAFLGGLIKLAI